MELETKTNLKPDSKFGTDPKVNIFFVPSKFLSMPREIQMEQKMKN
jgi:hypothetical protein